MGGMSAFIPSRTDEAVNERAFAKVLADKKREASQGFDGSWVAHPRFVSTCTEIFDEVLGDKPNQIDKPATDTGDTTAEQLLDLSSATGSITREGLRGNVDVGLRYIMAWLGGLGAVGIHNLMEDAATAEISRSQIWQWVRNESTLEDGTVVTADLVREVLDAEMDNIKDSDEGNNTKHLDTAREVFEQVALADEFVDFLTDPAYDAVVAR